MVTGLIRKFGRALLFATMSPADSFKKKAFPKHKIITTESWEKNGTVFEGKHAM